MIKLLLQSIFCLFLLSKSVVAEEIYEPTKENLDARRWFQDNKFGLFIHFGPYSVLEKGEWVLEKSELSVEEYEKLVLSKFNPTKFDPAAWVSMAKNAGMKYITVTSKHHDGFAMWETRQSDWNIVNRSPYGKDFLKSLADECHRQGIKLFFYYSQLDWHHKDYFPLGQTGHHAGRPLEGTFNKYLDYMDAQLIELLSCFGKIGGIWFDGMWDKPTADWRLRETYDMIHRLQPQALIGSNHHLTPFEGEDFQMFEKDLPGQSTQEFSNESTKISSLPLEMCETISHSWGYNSEDKNFKTLKELIHHLVKAAGNNANFLLNVGPRPNGTIQKEFVERLQAMGSWLKENGESIYGTRGGPIEPMPWGVATQKKDKIYLHILNSEVQPIAIPYLAITKARLFASGVELPFTQVDDHLLFNLSKSDIDKIDTIIELDLS